MDHCGGDSNARRLSHANVDGWSRSGSSLGDDRCPKEHGRSNRFGLPVNAARHVPVRWGSLGQLASPIRHATKKERIRITRNWMEPLSGLIPYDMKYLSIGSDKPRRSSTLCGRRRILVPARHLFLVSSRLRGLAGRPNRF
jgi:hypothetical protein